VGEGASAPQAALPGHGRLVAFSRNALAEALARPDCSGVATTYSLRCDEGSGYRAGQPGENHKIARVSRV
jgi:hypothetical protein